jgi:NAD(P)-dependent dehydrogenase (short-subunit alcohol dehydrogenase family)
MARKPKRPLDGRVAVVAGATRGAGRGIARALGDAGAIVYCTGRSTRGQPSPYARPETIDETAELIRQAGGAAIPVRVDHTIEAEVAALFARIDREHGRVDVLVNCIAGEDPALTQFGWFWAADLSRGDFALRQTILSHIITAKHAAERMIQARRGLIVEVTENDILMAGGNPFSQAAKLTHKGMALQLAAELRPYNVAALAVTPGFLRSEAVLEGFGVTEANWQDGGRKDPNFLNSESPLFVGRAVAALAADTRVIDRTGQLTSSWELSRHYRFTDADGRRPDWGRATIDFSVLPQSFLEYFRIGTRLQVDWLTTLTRRTKRFAKQVEQAASRPRHRPPGKKRR